MPRNNEATPLAKNTAGPTISSTVAIRTIRVSPANLQRLGDIRPFVHRRQVVARADGADVEAAADPFHGKALGEVDDAGFRG